MFFYAIPEEVSQPGLLGTYYSDEHLWEAYQNQPIKALSRGSEYTEEESSRVLEAV